MDLVLHIAYKICTDFHLFLVLAQAELNYSSVLMFLGDLLIDFIFMLK